MNSMQVIKYRYADAWPVWCIVADGVVLLCRQSEAEAQKALDKLLSEKMRGAE